MSRTTTWPRRRRLLKIGRFEVRSTRDGPEWFHDTVLTILWHGKGRHLRLVRPKDQA